MDWTRKKEQRPGIRFRAERIKQDETLVISIEGQGNPILTVGVDFGLGDLLYQADLAIQRFISQGIYDVVEDLTHLMVLQSILHERRTTGEALPMFWRTWRIVASRDHYISDTVCELLLTYDKSDVPEPDRTHLLRFLRRRTS